MIHAVFFCFFLRRVLVEGLGENCKSRLYELLVFSPKFEVNDPNLDFSWCRNFFSDVITPKLGVLPNYLIWLLCYILMYVVQ